MYRAEPGDPIRRLRAQEQIDGTSEGLRPARS